MRGLRPAAVVGGDVVEVSPAYDHAEITAIAAAHVLYDLRDDHGGAGHRLTGTPLHRALSPAFVTVHSRTGNERRTLPP